MHLNTYLRRSSGLLRNPLRYWLPLWRGCIMDTRTRARKKQQVRQIKLRILSGWTVSRQYWARDLTLDGPLSNSYRQRKQDVSVSILAFWLQIVPQNNGWQYQGDSYHRPRLIVAYGLILLLHWISFFKLSAYIYIYGPKFSVVYSIERHVQFETLRFSIYLDGSWARRSGE